MIDPIMIRVLRVSLCILGLAGSVNAAEMRPWTDHQNRKIEARLLALEGDSVRLELKDGHIISSTPISPPSGPATGYSNGLHRESNFLATSATSLFGTS
jgi:hypothetical protein